MNRRTLIKRAAASAVMFASGAGVVSAASEFERINRRIEVLSSALRADKEFLDSATESLDGGEMQIINLNGVFNNDVERHIGESLQKLSDAGYLIR